MDLRRTPGRQGVPAALPDDDDLILFEVRQSLGRLRFHGIVTDVARDDRHYSGGYKLLRCLLYGEPYQMRKTGCNHFGATASYTTLRLEPLDRTGQAREVLCFGELDSRIACGDEVVLETRCVHGRFHFLRGENLTLRAGIHSDPLCCSFAAILIPTLLLALTVLALLPYLKLLLTELAGSLIVIGAIGFLVYFTVLRPIARIFRRR